MKATTVQPTDSSTPASEYPFRVIAAVGSVNQQVVLTLRVGSDGYDAVSRAQTRFVARNSNESSISNTAVPGSTPPVSATPVCDIPGYRS